MTSTRGKSIGKFVNERLKDAGVGSSYWHENLEEFSDYIKKINPKDTLFLFDVSSVSYKVEKIIKVLERKLPSVNVMFFTAGKKPETLLNNIESIRLYDSSPDVLSDWKIYNKIVSQSMIIIMNILNHYVV